MFVIEDEIHAEIIGKYGTEKEAIHELMKLQQLRWDEEPNRAPCMGSDHCGRQYELREVDATVRPWKEIRLIATLHIDRFNSLLVNAF